MTQQFKSIDLFKFLFSICIVLQHFNLFKEFGTPAYYIFPLLLRLPVPFFFVCSGFFFARNAYRRASSELPEVTVRYIKRLLEKLIIFEIINNAIFVFQAIVNHDSINNILTDIFKSILFYPRGALWYIQAVIVCVLLFIPFIKYHKEEFLLPLGLVFYLAATLADRYYFLVSNHSIGKYIDLYIRLFESSRNAIGYGFFFVGAGVVICKHFSTPQKIRVRVWHLLTVLSFFVLASEAYIIRNHPGTDGNCMYIMHLVLLPALFVSLIHIDIDCPAILLRNLSTGIYLIHKPVRSVLRLFLSIMNVNVSSFILLLISFPIITVCCLYACRHKDSRLHRLLT